jgi:uncharacterized protein (DUF1015 family)
MIVKPFRGLRPRSDLATKIPSVPYDVVNTEEARELAADDPYSFLHVIRAEIDLGPDVDPFDDRVYTQGGARFRSMIDQGWLVRDEAPAYYVYRLRMGKHTQTGIVGAAAVDDYLKDRIKKHEYTRPAKERDRVRVIQALGAHPGPVFLTYPGVEALDREIATVVSQDPAVSFAAPDGVEHTLWVLDHIEACRRVEGLFAEIPATYIADGHHRAAAAAQACAGIRDRLADGSGRESCHYFLTVHFPAAEVRVMDYNRVVRDLNNLTVETLVQQIGDAGFDIESDHAGKRPPRRGTFGMYLAGRWYLLAARDIPRKELLGSLDVSLLSGRVLRPLLGIDDPRTDSRIDFVGGIRGMRELERRVDSGESAVAFALYPTSLEELMRVADAGEVMPPKSTWFEPKLRSGMVVQLLDEDLL